jgi:hypothetical protein
VNAAAEWPSMKSPQRNTLSLSSAPPCQPEPACLNCFGKGILPHNIKGIHIQLCLHNFCDRDDVLILSACAVRCRAVGLLGGGRVNNNE